MTSIWTLIGLLGLAFLGSALLGPRGAARFGLASGVEYVLAGIALGPVALGVLEKGTLATFDPVGGVAVGWLSLLIGLGFGYEGRRRVPARSQAFGIGLAAVTGAAIAGALIALFRATHAFAPADRVLIAGGVGAACAGTTRHLARWMSGRYGARGPVHRLFAEMADADDAVAIVATAVLFALHPVGGDAVRLSPWAWGGLSLGLGFVLGFTATMLLGRDFRLDASWGTLLGTGLLGIGLSQQLGLSPLTTMFAMGATISLTSGHRHEIVEMTRPTERAVLLPALLLAGAKIDFAVPLLVASVATGFGARAVSKLAGGLLIRSAIGPRVPRWIGLGLMPTGGLSIGVALSFALRFPGRIGDTVLAITAGLMIVGEMIGPPAFRAALAAIGEIREGAPMPSSSSLTPPPPEAAP